MRQQWSGCQGKASRVERPTAAADTRQSTRNCAHARERREEDSARHNSTRHTTETRLCRADAASTSWHVSASPGSSAAHHAHGFAASRERLGSPRHVVDCRLTHRCDSSSRSVSSRVEQREHTAHTRIFRMHSRRQFVCSCLITDQDPSKQHSSVSASTQRCKAVSFVHPSPTLCVCASPFQFPPLHGHIRP